MIDEEYLFINYGFIMAPTSHFSERGRKNMTDPFDESFQALLKQYREDGNMAPVLEKCAEIWREAHEVGYQRAVYESNRVAKDLDDALKASRISLEDRAFLRKVMKRERK